MPNEQTKPVITKEQRLRRVMLVCCHFARNMAYYRAGWQGKKFVHPHSDFWKIMNGNCLDIAILEWCKLFGDFNGRHYWRNIVSDPETFESRLIEGIGQGMTVETLKMIVEVARRYRDKFVAHLDNDLIAGIPALDEYWNAIQFYYRYVLDNEAKGISIHGLPSDLGAYYTTKFDEATAEYSR